MDEGFGALKSVFGFHVLLENWKSGFPNGGSLSLRVHLMGKSGFGFSKPDFGFSNKTRNPKTDFWLRAHNRRIKNRCKSFFGSRTQTENPWNSSLGFSLEIDFGEGFRCVKIRQDVVFYWKLQNPDLPIECNLKYATLGQFTTVVLQRIAKKCSKILITHVQNHRTTSYFRLVIILLPLLSWFAWAPYFRKEAREHFFFRAF